jgi:hypothetical protein
MRPYACRGFFECFFLRMLLYLPDSPSGLNEFELIGDMHIL